MKPIWVVEIFMNGAWQFDEAYNLRYMARHYARLIRNSYKTRVVKFVRAE